MMSAVPKRAVSDTSELLHLTMGNKHSAREKHATLLEAINLNSTIAARIIGRINLLFQLHDEQIRPWFDLWQEHSDSYFDVPAAEEILAENVEGKSGTRLFLCHTYCRLVLVELVRLAAQKLPIEPARRSFYDWIDYIDDSDLQEHRAEFCRLVARTTDLSSLSAVECSDLLATIYQEILPPALRHLLGEYYTPSWLVEYCIIHAERHRSSDGTKITIMDPAAGSGSFLAHYITHLALRKSVSPIKIVGFDVNPLAVDFCHANTLLAISKSNASASAATYELCIHLSDAVVDPIIDDAGPLFQDDTRRGKIVFGVAFIGGTAPESAISAAMRPYKTSPKFRAAFASLLKQYISDVVKASHSVGAKVVVGNPPWITWDGLTRPYRDRVAPQWATSTLVTNKGWKAKVSAGKTDFSSLFVYRAAQRHAAPNAVMVFVLPLSLFQSRLAGAGFRTFCTAEGRSFAPVQIDDFSDVKVFPDAVNRTSVGTFLVDRPSEYPIAYETWRTESSNSGRLEHTSALGGPLDPLEDNSPIIAFDEGQTELDTLVGKSDYRARGGVNTGGANTILWLEVIGESETYLKVRNVGKSRRSASAVIAGEVEREAVHPLLCGTDMQRWSAVPEKSILALYSPEQPKKALPVGLVKERFPKAYEFVSQFQTELEARKEYHRWGCSGPFYELYRIGPYTFSPIKVVWQHTGYRKALNVAVIDDRERQLIIPDQKVILIAFDNLEEAHYACAFLSSSITAGLLDRYLGTDASTHILEYVSLRRFVPNNKDHVRLAELSLAAHAAVAKKVPVVAIELEIDAVVGSLLRKA